MALNTNNKKQMLRTFWIVLLWILSLNILFPVFLNINKVYYNGKCYDYFIKDPIELHITNSYLKGKISDQDYCRTLNNNFNKLLSIADTADKYRNGWWWNNNLNFQMCSFAPFTYDLSRSFGYRTSVIGVYEQWDDTAKVNPYKRVFNCSPLDEVCYKAYLNTLRNNEKIFRDLLLFYKERITDISKYCDKQKTVEADTNYKKVLERHAVGFISWGKKFDLLLKNDTFITSYKTARNNDSLFKSFLKQNGLDIENSHSQYGDGVTIINSFFSQGEAKEIFKKNILKILNTKSSYDNIIITDKYILVLKYKIPGLSTRLIYDKNEYEHYRQQGLIKMIRFETKNIYLITNFLPVFFLLFIIALVLLYNRWKKFIELNNIFSIVSIISCLSIAFIFLCIYILPFISNLYWIYQFDISFFDKSILNQLRLYNHTETSWIDTIKVQFWLQGLTYGFICLFVFIWLKSSKIFAILFHVFINVLFVVLLMFVFNNLVDKYDMIMVIGNIGIFIIPSIFIRSPEDIRIEKERELKKEKENAKFQINAFDSIWHNIYPDMGRVYTLSIKMEEEIKCSKPINTRLSTRIMDIRNLMLLTKSIDVLKKPGGYFYDKMGKLNEDIIFEKINIKTYINEIIEGLKYNIIYENSNIIRSVGEVSRKLKENIDFLFDLDSLNDIEFEIEKNSLKVMLIDIIINATRKAYDKKRNNKPRVKIWTNDYNDYFYLYIRNECGIGKHDWEVWMKNKEGLSNENHFGLGIKLSISILEFYEFKWNIPDACIKENGGEYTVVEIKIKKNNKLNSIII